MLNTLKRVVVRNNVLSTTIALADTGDLRPNSTINNTHKRKTYPIRSRKETSGSANIITNEKTKVPMAAAIAPAALARFQKKPTRKIAKAPGLTKPVNSCINWKAWSKLPNKGASTTAITKLNRPQRRPTPTSRFSEASFTMYSL